MKKNIQKIISSKVFYKKMDGFDMFFSKAGNSYYRILINHIPSYNAAAEEVEINDYKVIHSTSQLTIVESSKTDLKMILDYNIIDANEDIINLFLDN